jgi:hypothetical protein
VEAKRVEMDQMDTSGKHACKRAGGCQILVFRILYYATLPKMKECSSETIWQDHVFILGSQANEMIRANRIHDECGCFALDAC